MSVETQLHLTYSEPAESSQLGLFSEPVTAEIHLMIDLDPELARWRRRAMFSTSVFLHMFLILFIIYAPALFRRGRLLMGIPVTPAKEPQVTTLFLPPDLLKSLREPPPEARPSDKNREAQGRSPKIDPNGIHMPYSRGNTPEPEIARGAPPAPPPAAAPTPPPGGPAAPQPSPGPKPEDQAQAQLRLEDATPPGNGGGEGKFRLPSMTPGQAMQQSLQAATQGGYHPGTGGAGAGGDSNLEFDNLHPNFSSVAPTILSDTRGVDFGPYLARVVMTVRRNWYAVMPESARLGEKGRVGIVFEILKDGSMPQIRMVASSGSDPLDRAAMNGIHASSPFPPLPAEFTGDHLVLQFIFLYNIAPPY
jgi:TonB family protein